ncbi:MAG: hypothetical protein QXN05_04530 [Acidilobaceae archaeon]
MSECRPRLDFLRNIFNTVLLEESSGRSLPLVVIEELKKRMARAEDRFKFSIYGGDPRGLIKFFESEEWRNIVSYANSTDALWVLKEALKRLKEDYEKSCPEVAIKAEEALKNITKLEKQSFQTQEHQITLDMLVRKLKLEGIQAEILTDEHGTRYVLIERPLVKVRVELSEGVIKYEIWRSGKTNSIEGLLAVLKKYESI